jgi:hypothetical protein
MLITCWKKRIHVDNDDRYPFWRTLSARPWQTKILLILRWSPSNWWLKLSEKQQMVSQTSLKFQVPFLTTIFQGLYAREYAERVLKAIR